MKLSLDIVDYGAVLLEYRKKRGLRQKDMANLLNVREGTIRSWELKHSKMPFHTIKKLKEIMNG